MERWNYVDSKESSLRDLDCKIQQVIELCKTLGISISHEDKHGAFIIEEWNEKNAKWLFDAFDGRGEK